MFMSADSARPMRTRDMYIITTAPLGDRFLLRLHIALTLASDNSASVPYVNRWTLLRLRLIKERTANGGLLIPDPITGDVLGLESKAYLT